MLLKSYQPVLFSHEIGNKPKAVQLFDKKLVLWRSKTDNNLYAIDDKCSHRGAKLSQGDLVGNCIECPYHGWQFDTKGRCVKIPQSKKGLIKPKKANLGSYQIIEDDGIVWAGLQDDMDAFIYQSNWSNTSKYFITDYPLDVPYNYVFQVENLLDPAHIHFVHNGFQGKKDNASYISVQDLDISEHNMSAYFVHENKDVPDIFIHFKMPYVIDISIMNDKKQIVRKNIIYMSPKSSSKTRILFRDVAVKKYITPDNESILGKHVNLFVNHLAKDFVDEHYQAINNEVVNAIMNQDVRVLTGQQENVKNYFDYQYVLPTESDRLIIEFRKWAKANKAIFESIGVAC